MVCKAEFEAKAKQAIPALFFMISASKDSQQAAEAKDVAKFGLPNPAGKAGGVCTAAFLQTMYKDKRAVKNISWVDLLKTMRRVLKSQGHNQIPQLSSSRLINIEDSVRIVPTNCQGIRRAVLIGINYVGKEGELTACHNDVKNVKEFLMKAQGFLERDILVLMDDVHSHAPTKRNIMKAFKKVVKCSEPGDVVYVHYSGHGGSVPDADGDEEDGFDETIIPADFKSAGQIVDDDIFDVLVKPMREGVTCIVMMDCCHSGTVLDLPFNYNPQKIGMGMGKRFVKKQLFKPHVTCNADGECKKTYCVIQ